MDPRFRICTLAHTAYKDETNPRSSVSLACHQVTRSSLNPAGYKGRCCARGFYLSVCLQISGYSYGSNLLGTSFSHPTLWGQLECLKQRTQPSAISTWWEYSYITRPSLCFQSAMQRAHSVENVCDMNKGHQRHSLIKNQLLQRTSSHPN